MIYILSVITPLYHVMLWLGILILFDLITGIIKAYKGGEKITSARMKDTAIKVLLYFILVLSAHLIDTQFLTFDFLPAKAAQIAAGFLAVIEVKSIFENARGILGVSIFQYIKEKINNVR